MAARHAMRNGKYLVVIDPLHQFYPPAAVAFGVALDRLVVVRPQNEADAMWAIDQSLRCSAVGAVIARIGKLSELHARRFQLAAEAGGSLGLFIRPSQVRYKPTWAEIQWFVEPRREVVLASGAWNASSQEMQKDFCPLVRKAAAVRHFRMQLLRMRGGRSGDRWNIAINTSNGSITAERPQHVPSSTLCLASELAKPTRSAAPPTGSSARPSTQSVRSASA